jgi:hypothetical protein
LLTDLGVKDLLADSAKDRAKKSSKIDEAEQATHDMITKFYQERIRLILSTHAIKLRPSHNYDRWKLPTPSFIATCNFSNITSFELYSGNFK